MSNALLITNYPENIYLSLISCSSSLQILWIVQALLMCMFLRQVFPCFFVVVMTDTLPGAPLLNVSNIFSFLCRASPDLLHNLML